jgi:hypothetical protein
MDSIHEVAPSSRAMMWWMAPDGIIGAKRSMHRA